MTAFDVLILGSGLAGQSLALRLADNLKVAIVTKRTLEDSASAWAQGGIAAVLDPGRDASTLIGALAPDTVRWLGGIGAPATLPGPAPGSPQLIDARRALPDTDPDGPWELRLGVGPSLGWNRAEVVEDLRSPRQLIDRFARTIAVGGRVLIDVPFRPDGTPSPAHLEALERRVWGDRWSDVLDQGLEGVEQRGEVCRGWSGLAARGKCAGQGLPAQATGAPETLLEGLGEDADVAGSVALGVAIEVDQGEGGERIGVHVS